MTIREYFDSLTATATADEMDEIFEMEDTLFHCYEDDFEDFSSWAIENGIDLTATATVMGEEIPVLTLWAWDHCED